MPRLCQPDTLVRYIYFVQNFRPALLCPLLLLGLLCRGQGKESSSLAKALRRRHLRWPIKLVKCLATNCNSVVRARMGVVGCSAAACNRDATRCRCCIQATCLQHTYYTPFLSGAECVAHRPIGLEVCKGQGHGFSIRVRSADGALVFPLTF